MKAIITKASDWNYEERREITTLEELKQIDNNIIINFDADKELYGDDIDIEVTIYDDYVE